MASKFTESEDDRRYREHIEDVSTNGRLAEVGDDGTVHVVYGDEEAARTAGLHIPSGRRIERVYWREGCDVLHGTRASRTLVRSAVDARSLTRPNLLNL